MEGVTTFRSTEYAQECMKKAEARLIKIQKFLVPSIVASVLFLVTGLLADKMEEGLFQNLLGLICLASIFIAPLVIFSCTGAWFYWGKFISLPFRKLKGAGFIGIIIALLIFVFCWYMISIAGGMGFSIIILLYEKYLCNITIECAKDYMPA